MAEVAVVGGGPVGACAAALLQRGGLEVTLLEPHPPAPLEAHAPLDSRVVALSRASERLLSAAGAWPLIAAARVCAYERMRIWHESVAASQCRGAGVRRRRRRGAEPRLHPREPPAAAGAARGLHRRRRPHHRTPRSSRSRSPRTACACARRKGSWRRSSWWGRTGRTRGCARPRASPPRAARTSSWRSSPTSPPPSRISSPPGSAS